MKFDLSSMQNCATFGSAFRVEDGCDMEFLAADKRGQTRTFLGGIC
ncbi:MAG: hypothetical protein V1888_02445 [archaeon]